MKCALAGVYFLSQKGRLVYVGRSSNIWSRIADHTHNTSVFYGEWDEWDFFEIQDADDREAVEARLIRDLQPKLNRRKQSEDSVSECSCGGADGGGRRRETVRE